ncbi:MAG: chemotaxis protein CheB [Planctomycetaceae bacterium]
MKKPPKKKDSIKPSKNASRVGEERNLPEESAFPIVGVGASAGGLKAAERFLSKVSPDSGMAFVLVLHLDPAHASMAPELLGRSISLKVVQAEDGVEVQPNRVYVIPPNKEMSIYHGTLHLSPPSITRGIRMPIDAFFRSLAEDQEERAIGVVLSGTGTDGTLGLRAIHGTGGIVMVQESSTAEYGGMPESAVKTGIADYVLPVEQMASWLSDYVGRTAFERRKPPKSDQDGLHKILQIVRSRTGQDFHLYKKATLNRRIQKRMNLHGLQKVEDYIRYLRQNSEEVPLLFKDLVVRVTQFFRDPEAFEALRKRVLPEYLERLPEGYVFRAWVPGCGTGEEAYSIAMILAECAREMKKNLRFQIFGSDIDSDAIQSARTGAYMDNIGMDVGPERLKSFFTREGNIHRVKKEIRESIVFALQDLIKDPPFTKLDLLSCRNLLIYLEPEMQERLMGLFNYSLKTEGILFLGTSETVGRFTDLFSVVDRKWKIFRAKKVDAPLRDELLTSLPWSQHHPEGRPDEVIRQPHDVTSSALKILVDSFAPPSVIVSEQGEILYIHGETGKYLQPPVGRPIWNILDMAREGLHLELRSGLHLAATKGAEKRYEKLKIKTNGGQQIVNLTLKPLKESKKTRGMVVVSFEDAAPEKTEDKGKKGKRRPEKEERTRELERDLADTRETLQSTIEELQASNEELKSANEELQSTNEEFQSTNEELETSREELQSVNEELVTVNSELESKIVELSGVERQMNVLLEKTGLGIILLDRDLRIQRFTAKSEVAFNFIPSDVGRPIRDIRSNLKGVNLEEECRRVLNNLQIRELDVESQEGRLLLLRILPHSSDEKKIEGVMITFLDVTETRQKEMEQAAIGYMECVVETIREPLLILGKDLRVIHASRSFLEIFEVNRKETEGRSIYELGGGQWDIPEFRKLLEEILPEGKEVEGYEVEHDFLRAGRRRLSIRGRKITPEGAGLPSMILLSFEDVTG